MTAFVRLSGFAELQAQLEKLKPATGRAALRRALLKAAQPVVEAAQSLAISENRSGEATGALSRSIVVSTRAKGDTRDQGTAAFAATLRGGGNRAEAVRAMRTAQRNANAGTFAQVYVGPKQARSAREGAKQIVTEFGSLHVSPQPYMRPAWDQEKNDALQRLRSDISTEINKAIARAARRAARRA